MSLYLQGLLDTHDELVVDLFAGGGGASSGFEQATGRMVDVAINHDAAAVALHEANHPQTRHYRADVFEVCPREVTQGRAVGFLWASPDCTFHSKARGGKPIRSATKKRRALAWVVTRWAGQVRPRVIMLENVEEFAQWGPLVGGKDDLRPCPRRRGKTFRRWVRSLTDLGYAVEWRELRACDYGAPTIRKRLFLIARCDGEAIVWPEPTHGPGRPKPYATAASCIDWSIPMCSIFATKDEAKAWGKAHGQNAPIRPLAANTERRIARGVRRYVLESPRPYLVTIAHGEGGGESKRWGSGVAGVDAPLSTVMTKNQFAVAAPVMLRNQTSERSKPADDPMAPLGTVLACGANHAVVAPVMVKNNHGDKPFSDPQEPLPTVVAGGTHHMVAAPFLAPRYGEREGQEPRVRSVEDPAPTVVNTGNGGSLVAAHVTKFRNGSTGQTMDEPMATVTSNSAETARPGGAAPIGVVAASVTTYYGGPGGESRGVDLEEPLRVQGTENRFGVVASFLAQNNEGFYKGDGRPMDAPHPAVCSQGSTQSLVGVALTKQRGTSTDADPQDPLDTISAGGLHHGVAAAHLQRDFGNSVGQPADEPAHTVTGGGGGKCSLVASFLQKYYGTAEGQPIDEPAHTIPTVDRFGCVTVQIGEETFVIEDIAMRMLQPKELYAAQGFRSGYVIDRGADGRMLTKTEQVRMVGNSVCPPVAEALVRANVPEMVVRELPKAKAKGVRRAA